jgi:hypothetical protein
MHVHKRKTVFISGSAYEYGSFGDDGKLFIRDLSRTLLKNGFTIVSGFGYGVGNYVLEGALEELYVEQQERMTDRLKVYPFPTRLQLMENIQKNYRDDMISQAGTAIFLFGNKLEDITVRAADGMLKEFEIARSYRVRLIPVGASGYISARLWRELLGSYDEYFDSRELFGLYERIGDPSIGSEELIDTILQIADSTPQATMMIPEL